MINKVSYKFGININKIKTTTYEDIDQIFKFTP